MIGVKDLTSLPEFVTRVEQGHNGPALHDWYMEATGNRVSLRTIQEAAREVRNWDGAENVFCPEDRGPCIAGSGQCGFFYRPTPGQIDQQDRLVELLRKMDPTRAHDPVQVEVSFPESTEPLCDQWLKVEGDRLVLSDLHIPFHSATVLQSAVKQAKAMKVARFLIAGDTFDGGHWHPKRGLHQHHGRRWQDDVETCKVIFKVLLDHFDGGEVISGNHDGWFQSHMRGQCDADWLMENLFHEFKGRVVWSGFEQCDLVSGGKTFKVLHGNNYSGPNPLGVAQGLASKFECGIIVGHQHHACAGWSKSGLHQVCCLGGCYDARRLAYLHHSPRTNPCPTNGFAIVKDGWVKVFDHDLRG